jgi:hypothetical protein
MKVFIPPEESGLSNGFCIDNIFWPSQRDWYMLSNYGGIDGPPDFQGQPNTSSTNPDAPPVCVSIRSEPCVWNPGDNHKMHFPQLPDEAGWDVNSSFPSQPADDWECSESGWVKDIHFWGSWKDGITGQIDGFGIGIYADVPAGVDLPWSHPEDYPLMSYYINDFSSTRIDPPTEEGWYDPSTGEVIWNHSQSYYQYDICFENELFWFWQDSGTVYWLSVSAMHSGTEEQWGWKSSIDHWNDNAVFLNGSTWNELYEPGIPDTIVNTFQCTFDPNMNLNGSGDGYNNSFYPYSDDWHAMWYYNNPYDSSGHKNIHIEIAYWAGNEMDIALGWSTDQWSLDQPPEDSIPPLPGVDEQLYIVRVDLGGVYEGHLTYDFTIPDYCPEWVSIYVRGQACQISGTISHSCVTLGTQPLDFAFVITGGEDEICDCVPGDANGDGEVNVGDAVYLISYVFKGGPQPTPYEFCSGDANCDCTVNVGDAVYIISYVFKGGPAPCNCEEWSTSCGQPFRK